MTYSQVRGKRITEFICQKPKDTEDFVRNTDKLGKLKEHIKNDDVLQKFLVIPWQVIIIAKTLRTCRVLGLEGSYSFYPELNLENLLQILSSASSLPLHHQTTTHSLCLGGDDQFSQRY